jgi:membrane protease YdiL (CAAX protease family)
MSGDRAQSRYWVDAAAWSEYEELERIHSRPTVAGRVGVRWYVAIIALSGLALCAMVLSIVLGAPAPEVTTTLPLAVALFAFSIFPGSALGEEIGWRGYALPRLQARRSALTASVILGAVWGTYHLPLFLIGAETRPPSLFLPFLISTVISSIFYTWMYNGTGGSLFIVVLLHAAANLPLKPRCGPRRWAGRPRPAVRSRRPAPHCWGGGYG